MHITTYDTGIRARAAKAGAAVVSWPECSGELLPAGFATCTALLKAAGVDAVVMVSTGHVEGEQHDRAALGLRPDQLGLLRAVHAALPSSVKKVLAVVAGGAVSTERAESLVDATVWSGKPGMQVNGCPVSATKEMRCR